MKLVIFGLSVSSSWGNGHATLWRGLCRALGQAGHEVVFFERDVPYYARHRDLHAGEGFELRLYPDGRALARAAGSALAGADAGFVTSYCPDAALATELLIEAGVGVRVFYDLDTPVTLARLASGQVVEYLPDGGLGAFDLVLSYTGGKALAQLHERLGAREVAPLYGSVDPHAHRPVAGRDQYACALSYLGTWAADRQDKLETLLLRPAARRPDERFMIGGSLYPGDFPWAPNVWFLPHVPPPEHPAFYCSSRLTLSITRGVMATNGWCPSGRLFEAAACGVPIVSDGWDGLASFFEPGRELLVADTSEDVLAALDLGEAELRRIGAAARARVLAEHTARHRAAELVAHLRAAAA